MRGEKGERKREEEGRLGTRVTEGRKREMKGKREGKRVKN